MIEPYSPVEGLLFLEIACLLAALVTGGYAGRKAGFAAFAAMTGICIFLMKDDIHQSAEINDRRYTSLAQRASIDPKVRALAVSAMLDGKVTESEYRSIYHAWKSETPVDERRMLSAALTNEEGPSL